MAIYPWVLKHPVLQVDLDDFPRVAEWFARIEERPATVRAYEMRVALIAVGSNPALTLASNRDDM